MPRRQDRLDHDRLTDIIGDEEKSTEKIRKQYLDATDRDSLSHKVVKRALDQLEDDGVVDSSRPEDVKLILWRCQ